MFHQHLDGSDELQRDLWLLSGLRLLCHCQRGEECHGDVLILKFKEVYPTAFDRDRVDQPPPSSSILNYLARLREAPPSDEGSTSDEGVPPKNSGWRGPGKPMQVGTGYLQRDYCDGQSLASPGRWPVDQRRYPSSRQWNGVVRIFRRFTEQFCTPDLLMRLALGRVEVCPFDSREVSELKESVIKELASEGLHLTRKAEDRADVPMDFRFFDLLLRSSEDPEVGLGEFAVGVRVGPGARMPRLPALYKAKKKWRLASQANSQDYLDDEEATEGKWRRNYSSVSQLADKVIEVMEDQTARGQLIKLSEAEARRQYPGLVVASLGAVRKDRPNGEVTARVVFDGNPRTSCQQQNTNPRPGALPDRRRPEACDEREGGERGENVRINSGCQRGTPPNTNTSPGLAFVGLPGPGGRRRLHQHRGNFWCSVGVILLVKGSLGARASDSISRGSQGQHLAHGGSGRLPPGGWRARVPSRATDFLRALCGRGSSAVLEQDSRW